MAPSSPRPGSDGPSPEELARANDREADRELEEVLEDASPESPADFADRMAIRADLEAYVLSAPVRFNPDADTVDRVILGLEARAKKTGMRLCPCRMASGDPEKDRAIVCPCVYHLDEIARDGHCHCHLFVRP